MLVADPYNKFCVDCHHSQSTHACLAYGIFVCAACANIHAASFGGRSRSQVKEVFTEQWDDFQLEAVAPGVGGNKPFYTYLQEYEGLAQQPIEKKYRSDQVQWYMKRIAAHLDQRVFSEKQPAKDWDERFERAKSSMKNLIASAKPSDKEASKKQPEAGVVEESKQAVEGAPQIASGVAEPSKVKEWAGKFKGFFKDKFTKNASKDVASLPVEVETVSSEVVTTSDQPAT